MIIVHPYPLPEHVVGNMLSATGMPCEFAILGEFCVEPRMAYVYCVRQDEGSTSEGLETSQISIRVVKANEEFLDDPNNRVVMLDDVLRAGLAALSAKETA